MPKELNGKIWILGHVHYRGSNCLLWPMSISRGYGQVCIGNGKTMKAHRLMCQLAHGDPPTSKHEASHACGNPSCVNPKHLAWKTRSENQLESVAMGRQYRNGRRGTLTAAAVREITALKGKVSQNKLAARFGVTYSTVAKIHRGEMWKAYTCRKCGG